MTEQSISVNKRVVQVVAVQEIKSLDKQTLARLIVALISYLGIRDHVFKMLRGY